MIVVESLSQPDFDLVRELLRTKAAIVLGAEKKYLAESRLHGLAREEGAASVKALLEKLRSEPGGDLAAKIIGCLTINETSFFRDPEAFEVLRTVVLPERMKALQRGGGMLRVWSAACSAGQEPYSLAMILKEEYPFLESTQVRILASDIDGKMVRRTQEARYSQLEVNRGLPAQLLVKYFEQEGRDWTFCEDLRELVDVHQINLAGSWPTLPPQDIVLLRNVLIYFAPETRQEILSRMACILRPGGCLILGMAEAMISASEWFDVEKCGRIALHRRKDR